ncbi:MAG: glycoside hydrolase family 5 protein, partial [Fimbriimonadaceae bacterium]|nr:glycoside hydrolase family 5 protein [Fimbriimonadaceae bacterium]
DFKLATDFWQTCAREFGKDGRVVFQLWCEPVLNAEDWQTPLGSTWKTLKPFFQSLTDTIRKEGAQNVLLATGNRWAYDLVGIRQSLLPDKDTAYMWHVYAGHDNNDPKLWDEKLDGLHKVRPVVVTEWGFERNPNAHYDGSAFDFGRPFLRYMNERGLHWTAWCWHDTWGPTMFERGTRTPNAFGEFVMKALAAERTPLVRPQAGPIIGALTDS